VSLTLAMTFLEYYKVRGAWCVCVEYFKVRGVWCVLSCTAQAECPSPPVGIVQQVRAL
jgi:hypothetical protein